jgi:hypothetical protein
MLEKAHNQLYYPFFTLFGAWLSLRARCAVRQDEAPGRSNFHRLVLAVRLRPGWVVISDILSTGIQQVKISTFMLQVALNRYPTLV